MIDRDADRLLLEKLNTGSEKAFEEVFRRYYRKLVIEAFHLLKDEMEAEDLVQQLFIDLWDRELFRQVTCALTAYLHRSVRNKCLDHLDKRKTEQQRYTAFSREQELVQHEDYLEIKEANERVAAILGDLPLQRMRAFSLVYLEDMKYKEAADEMGITVNSIKTHLKLALKALHSKFEKS